ncbi:MAG: cytochrome-c peroxidase, partial [Bacteroidia bacterium]
YGFFWDGRASSLEKQASEPVKNPLEMDLTWDEAVVRLQRHPKYPEQFKKAFGTDKVTEQNATKAIAQFLRTIVSADSKFDKAMRLNELNLTESEQRGLALYNGHPEKDGLGEYTGGGNCEHCHGNPAMFVMQPMDAASAYRNNGLDSVKSIFEFKDFGYALTKPDTQNYGKFKAPSLRNVELTAPYMHDGRLKTLEEVIEHYNNGGHKSPTIDGEMARNKFPDSEGKLQLSAQDKKDLIAFLKTLTDRNLTTNPAYASPFK